MKKLAALSLVVIASTLAHAQAKPTIGLKDARLLYDQFDQTLSSVGLWEKTTQAERTQRVQAAMRLQERFSKAFGQTSACSNAASDHVEFVTNLNKIAYSAQAHSEPSKPFNAMMALATAERFGNNRAGCFDEIEALNKQ